MAKGWDGFESKINILNTGRLNIVKNLHNLNIWVTGHFESTYSAGHGWLCDENGWLVELPNQVDQLNTKPYFFLCTANISFPPKHTMYQPAPITWTFMYSISYFKFACNIASSGSKYRAANVSHTQYWYTWRTSCGFCCSSLTYPSPPMILQLPWDYL